MKYLLQISDKADKEFIEAAKWYEKQSEGLGLKFIGVIERKLIVIQQYPERYPIRKLNFRAASVRTFPYLIIYKFYKRKKQIVVYSIFHSRRNPKHRYR